MGGSRRRHIALATEPYADAPMGTRSGDVDPEVMLQLMTSRDGYTADEVKELIYKKSGLLGISGISSDLRDILKSADRKKSPGGMLALNIFTRSIRRLHSEHYRTQPRRKNGCVNFHSRYRRELRHTARSMICKGLEIFGLRLDTKN